MRINYPKDVCDALDACAPYAYYDTKTRKIVLKKDTPPEIVKGYHEAIAKKREIDKQYRM